MRLDANRFAVRVQLRNSTACRASEIPAGSARSLAAALLAYLGMAIMCSAAVAAETEEPLIELVVTGSRLSSANASSPSPVVVLDNEELMHQGTARA